jgi:hypothetical protein
MEPIKLTEEELTKFAEIQAKNNAVVNQLGNLELTKLQVENRRVEILNFLNELREEENEFGKELTEKYGEGSIDLQTGEFLPTPALETAE